MEEFDKRIRYSLYSWRNFVEGFSIIVFDFCPDGKNKYNLTAEVAKHTEVIFSNFSLVPKFLFGNCETTQVY